MTYQCACHQTDRPYTYKGSTDEAHDRIQREADELWEIFKAKHRGRVCRHQSHYGRTTKIWTAHYDPLDCVHMNCTYCDVLAKELDTHRGNVFYDLRKSWTVKGVGLFPDQRKTIVEKGCKLLHETVSLTVCEAIIKYGRREIEHHIRMKYHREWNLQGYHQMVYELHADKLEEISKKYQAGIGYDYDKAVEKCRKKRGKKLRDDDVGGEALAMAYRKAQRTAASKGKSSLSPAPASSGKEMADVPMKVEQVEHYDIFEDDVITFWVDLSGAPQAMQAEARQIDGEHFDPNCFGVCIDYDFDEHQFYIVYIK